MLELLMIGKPSNMHIEPFLSSSDILLLLEQELACQDVTNHCIAVKQPQVCQYPEVGLTAPISQSKCSQSHAVLCKLQSQAASQHEQE